jgi:NAD(P)-dependent dehydrogenase (short-subunit alcohol dehydrogenase family)
VLLVKTKYQVGAVMDEQNFNRRQLLGGLAVAGGAGLLGAAVAGAAQAAEAATPDLGPSQPPPITDVRDKVAYITGGSSGIGLGIARALHEAGARVILGNYDDKQFAEALKQFPEGDKRVQTMVHDVMDRDAWERKADEIEKKFGAVNILVNNAGVGVMSGVVAASMKDWDWAMGVNFWGPLYGVRTFVPRMLAGKQGSHIVTTTSTDGVLLGTAGVYAVTKLAVTGLMEQMRHDLRATNIGTSNLVPGMTTSNLGRTESYRPETMKNEAPPVAASPRPAGPRPAMPQPPADTPPLWARPQTALTAGRLVVNGIINNDMWIFPAPEYRVGLQARCDAMLESMVDYLPMPEHIAAGHDRYYRTPIYVQEVAHRRATRKRVIPGV